MNLFSLIYSPFRVSYTEIAVIQFCNLLGLKSTRTGILNKLNRHPLYPSLLSIGDTLREYSIESISIKTDINQLKTFPTPILAQIQMSQATYFTVISEIEKDEIRFLNPVSKKWELIKNEKFKEIFTGIALLAELSDSSIEPNYRQRLIQERLNISGRYTAISVIPFLVVIAGSTAFHGYGIQSLSAVLFMFFSVIGAVISSLLVWNDINRHNPVLKNICGNYGKVNCNAVLQSKVSKFYGMSWSTVGLVYFFGQILCLLYSRVYNQSVLFILGCLSACSLPFILYSIYYQWKVLGQWCILCLAIQGTLILQFATALYGKYFVYLVDTNLFPSLLIIALSFSIPFIVANILLSTIHRYKVKIDQLKPSQNIKYNREVFSALLVRQKKITTLTEGLGVVIGNPDAEHRLITISNPYCTPCSNAHQQLHDLVKKHPDVNVQIIFTASGEDGDIRTQPVSHFLAISESNDRFLTEKALNDWYMAADKNYDVFAAKYPLKGDLAEQKEKIKTMNDWCQKMLITFTPTLFCDGYQLPSMYSITDLKYFL